MTDYPPGILKAGTDAIEWMVSEGCSDETLARAVLDATAPLLAEACAQAVLAHMEAHGPKVTARRGTANRSREETLARAWRRYFGTAARVAARAFSTDEELRRMAAQALAAGNYVACRPAETGESET